MSSPVSKRVLLTGANGYLAQHILSQFLAAGHSVRGIVRSASKAFQLQASPVFSSYPSSKLDFAVVPDMTIPGAFGQVLMSEPPFDWVIHTASPFNYRNADSNSSSEENFLNPAIKGTTEILSGIRRVAPAVRRVILTSSMAAVLSWEKDFQAVTHPARIFTGQDWNPISWEEALTSSVPNRAYQASKTFAERAAWEFVEKEKPGFELVTMNPPAIFGPLMDAGQLASPQELNQSTWHIYSQLLSPEHDNTHPVPPTFLHLYVDVRDVARAHLLGAAVPEAGGKRFVLCAGEMSMQRIANLLREALPVKRDVVPKGDPENWRMEEGTFMASTADAENILGLKFTSAESTIGDMGKQMVELEKRATQQ
ncbi:NADPH-dependent methylglyoxal reductase GRP2-like protein 3 [Seiridium cupressi]